MGTDLDGEFTRNSYFDTVQIDGRVRALGSGELDIVAFSLEYVVRVSGFRQIPTLF